MTQKETDSIRATMTKMEHYKKRLLQQHERPSPMVSPAPTTEEEYDSPPQSPTNPSQNNPRERKKEEMIQSKVARKRAVCRSKFRHQNLELFKLGSSIPTSLCKTKEPYNVCTEKNLQMCNQSQNGKKSEENIAKESITESIINTMEGNKRKDILWRSISLNNDKSEKPNKPSNIVETTSKNNSGRHILPAIVPEIPERRKAKTNIRENKTGTTEKGNRMETDLMIRNADPISINKRKTVVKRRKTVIGIESCETEGQNADEESVSDSLDGPNRETDSEPASRRRQSVSTESEVSNNSPINLSLRNKEPSTRVEVAPARVINDPRLYTKPSQYLQHILPNPCNTLTTSSAQNHESTRVGEQSTATTSITYNHEPARTRTTGSDGQFTHSTPQTHEPGRNYVAPNIPPVQSQEPIQNYNTGLAIPSTSSSNHEPSRNYVAEYSTLSALSKRFEPLNNNAAASINTPRLLFQNHEPPRSYFPVPSTTSSASIASYQSSFAGANFPQIQQQMTRLDNATLPVQNWPVNPSVTYNEEVIKTIIQLAKSSMNPNFSIETLLILNKWFIELRSHSTQQAISKRIKTSIMRTLNEIILYVCEKLFGVPCYAQLKSYVEQIIQVVAPRHKDLLTDLLPSFRINYNNEQWMSGIIKLLSLPALPPDPRNQVNTLHNLGHNIVNTHPNAMYNVPVTSHNFPHPPQNLPLVPQNHPPPAQNQPMASQNYPLPPQNYFYQNFLQPSLSYQGYPYQPNSSLQANYLLNTEHQRALMPYQNNGPLEAAAELQRNQQNIQALYQNAIQNFQRPPDNYNPLPVSRPEMFLADNRCVPSEQGLQRLQDQNKRSKSKSKKKDRLDIIPIIPATSAVMAVPNNVNNHSQKVTSDQDRQPTNKISKKPIKTRTPVISRQSSETSTCSSNSTEQRTAPDVEELLQTNFIYNNSRMGNANTDETTSATTKTNLPTSDKSTTNKDVNGKNDENIITVINNSESNNLTDMMQEMMTIDSQDIKSEDAVANTVIVKDKSMEITRGKSNECFSSKELKDEVMDEVSNDVILEKVQNETDDSTASTSVQIDLGMLIKDEVKVELHGLTNKMRQLVGGNNPALKLQIIREVLGDNEDYLQYLLDRRAQRNKLLDPNEVIMIDDDDEDMSIEKVPDMQQATDNDRPPKLIKLVPTKRKDNESDREHQEKKLRTKVPSSKKSNEIIIVDANVEDIQSNSDCNQNYITTITDETKIDELPKEPNEESDSVTPSIRVLSDKTTPSPIKTSTVVTDVIETTNSPIVNPQTPSAAVAETPVIEDISSDEEYTKHFRLHSRYVRKPIENAEDIPDNLEVSQCTLIESTVNSIVKASKNGNFSDKPLVYTRAAMPRNRSEKSSATKTNEQGTIIESRKWSCLSSIIRFEEDSSTTTSFVNVQPAWDVNYVGPQLPERHYPASPPYHIAAESSLTLPQYANDRFRTSPMSSPSRRFSPDFRSPSRSVPTSPVCPSPSTTPSLVMSPSTSATAQTEFNKSRVNWQDWFAEEKSKGFFNFDRSQSVESESASRRRSVDTVGSGGSDYCSKILPEDNYCEIKIDSKTCRIKRTLYNRIPKGKLCYIRENNTFIRYFDDSQMELFIRNLNISEGSSIASDLLKQIKGRVEGVIDVETSLSQYEASGKNEIITLPKAVTFSTADNLSDPVLYVEEVEKVQQYVPRDFYGFYKYVTGYQIVNHHTPISFQTFLTMHNTNGIKGLFKTYVKTMIDGHTIL